MSMVGEDLQLFCSSKPSTAALLAAGKRLESFLQSAELRLAEARHLVRKVYLLDCQGVKLVWKPGVDTGMREVAAYRLDRLLDHTCRVLPTVMRCEGLLTFFVANSKPAHLDPRSPYVLQNPERNEYYRLALLDCLIGNRDRHAGNWLVTAAGTTIPIDHGLAFPSHNEQIRYKAYDFRIPVRLRDSDRQRLERVRVGLSQELSPLIGDAAVEATIARVDRLLAEGKTFGWGRSDLRVKDTFQVRFQAETGLDDVELTDPDGYRTLLEHIKVHRYYEQHAKLADAARSWHETVYSPVVQAIREGGLRREFPSKTDGDLYLWLTYHRERMGRPPDDQVARSLARYFSERPWRRVWKTLKRMWAAAWETPEPRPPAAGAWRATG